MKENAKHTPGTWFITPDTTNKNGDYAVWTDDSPFSIATVHGSGNSQALANAALIAAAPDLLAACELVLKNGYRMPCQGQDDGDKIIMRDLAAAIAKAKGK